MNEQRLTDEQIAVLRSELRGWSDMFVNNSTRYLTVFEAETYRLLSRCIDAVSQLKAAREEIARLKKYEPMVDDGSDRELQAMYAEIEGDE